MIFRGKIDIKHDTKAFMEAEGVITDAQISISKLDTTLAFLAGASKKSSVLESLSFNLFTSIHVHISAMQSVNRDFAVAIMSTSDLGSKLAYSCVSSA